MLGSWLNIELTHPVLLAGLLAVAALVFYFYRSLVDFPRVKAWFRWRPAS